jgi:hypothetical protein
MDHVAGTETRNALMPVVLAIVREFEVLFGVGIDTSFALDGVPLRSHAVLA